MEPIVSPYIIYLISILGSISEIAVAFAALMAAVILLYHGYKFSMVILTERGRGQTREEYEQEVKNDINEWKEKWAIPVFLGISKIKLVYFGFVFMLIFSIAIPSKNTMIAMIVANEITYERVEKTGKAFGELKNDIVGSVQQMMDGVNIENLPDANDINVDSVLEKLPDEDAEKLKSFFNEYNRLKE